MAKGANTLPASANKDYVKMGDYVEGHPSSEFHQNIDVTGHVDVGAIANAVANAIGQIVVPAAGGSVTGEGQQFHPKVDIFDNQKSMERLADAMTVQRSDSTSNFEDLGGVKETRKDQKVLKKTLDLLKGLED